MGCCCSAPVAPHYELPQDEPEGLVRLTAETDQAFIDKVVDAAGRSFAGTVETEPEPNLSWAFADGEGPVTGYGPLPNPPSAERIKAMKWVVAYTLGICLRHGACFALVDPNNKENVLSVAYLIPPNDKKLHAPGLCEQMRVGGKVGSAPKQMFTKEMKAVDKTFSTSHKVHASERHWYVFGFATAIPAMRQGNGTRLLNYLTSIADRSGHPIYLETSGAGKERFYGNCGFEVVKRYPLTTKKGDTDVEGLAVSAMVRKAKK